MATTGPSGQSAGVLLVDADTLLLQGGNEEDTADVASDLLERALQNASALNTSGTSSHEDGEVKFGPLQNGNDVVAIFQGDSGETHTIKMTREQLESLGLQIENKSSDCTNGGASAVSVCNSVTTVTPTPAASLMASHENLLPMVQDNLLSTLPNMVTEGRIIDEEGNIVQADDMQILSNSLSSYMDHDVGQAITIVPQYGMDGMVTYAVKLKDANDLTSSDYTLSSTSVITTKDEEEPKTGLDIEVEMARANIKRSMAPLEEAVPVPTSSESVPMSTAISIPNLPLTATIPRVTDSRKFVSVVPTSASTSVQNSYFRILPDRSAMNIGAIASAVQPSMDVQPMQNNVANIVPDSVTRPAVSKLQSSLSFPIAASSLNTTLASGRSFNVSSNSQLGLNVFSIMNPSSVMPATSTSTFRTITPNGLSVKTPMRPTPPRASPLQTTTSRLLPITTTKVTSVNVIPTQSTIMTSATTSQPAIAAAAITKVCQPITAAGSRAPNHLNTKPLGSSENPIQLVQQGQTFHSMQALSQSQLHQIATVLQQKHIGGMPKKNVVFDEQTKTRIVYRVVYPEDVDLQQPNSPIEGRDASTFRAANIQTTKPKSRGRGRPSKTNRSQTYPHNQTDGQNGEGDDDDKGPDDSSKGDRKKIVARTRSGRLSRPPRHMLKDYKRLHHLDFWEPDMDDSDGGYSDYLTAADPNATRTANRPGDTVNGVPTNVSAAVPTEENPANKEKELLKGLVPKKRRVSSRFSCPTCQKIYLGHSRMARHFTRFPDHGSIEEFSKEEGKDKRKHAVTEIKRRGARGRKRAHWAHRTPQERSEQRKNKLRQMIATCEPQELVEVVGPLIARTLTLWDLLLLRLESLDRPTKLKTEKPDVTDETNPASSCDVDGGNSQLANSNRVAWLLIELRSLLDSVRSIAGDLLKPQEVGDGSVENIVEIAEQALSNMLGMACGTYVADDRLLYPQREEDIPSEAKRTRLETEHDLSVPDKNSCDIVPSDVEMAAKEDSETAKSVSPMKLPDDIPMTFLNSSDDMICDGDDADVSTDSKHCDDSEAAANMKVVDDIVNERLQNLEENMNFTVSLPSQLEPAITNPTPDLLMSDFTDSATSLSVTNPSVITRVADTGTSVGVRSIDLMNTYDSTMNSLTEVTPSSNDLAGSLSTAASQEMLSSYSMTLSSLMSIPSALQSEPTSSVEHAADSFLESLSSFESASCTDGGVSYEDSVLKDNSVLRLSGEPPQRLQSPPKFISTFTPAETNGKPSEPITTAQRLQRDYRFSERSMGLELDSGLDVGLDTDLDFEALTEELNRNTQN